MTTKSCNPSWGGFTLIELMFVTFLFLLLAGFSAAAFRRSWEAFGQRVVIHDLLDLMNFAHERAILERVDYGVHLVPHDNTYWLVRRQGENAHSEFVRIPATWGAAHHFPRGVEYKDAETSVVFYPDGTTEPRTLELASLTHRLTLVMDPVSGKGIVNEAIK